MDEGREIKGSILKFKLCCGGPGHPSMSQLPSWHVNIKKSAVV